MLKKKDEQETIYIARSSKNTHMILIERLKKGN
jgi:hypothetical protein